MASSTGSAQSSNLFAAALRYVTRKPYAAKPANVFSTVETSFARTFAPAAIGLIVVESTAVHFFVDQIESDTLRLALHVVLYVLEIYSILWLMADLRLMKETGHEVGQDGIHLTLGSRTQAFLPWSRIASAEAHTYSKPELALMKPEAKEAHKAAEALSVTITPGETPNILIELTEPIEAELVFGMRKKASTYRVYVDDPKGFVAAVVAVAPELNPAHRPTVS